VVKSNASTGEQAATRGRQISYAEVGETYAGVVDGRPVKGATAGVDSSAPLPTKKGASPEGKRRRDDKVSRGTHPVTKSPRREKEVTVANTAGGHLDAHTKKTKRDAQAHRQGYRHCVRTCCFDGSSFNAHLSRGTR
jgi:hypothetical protein